MAATVALALGAAALWGAADFLGGLTSRAIKAATVVLWVNLSGLVAAGIVVLATGARISGDGLAWGCAAGLVSGVGFIAFYAALSAGSMSLVAPITACGAVVPVAIAFAEGESVAAHVGIGMAIAFSGAVLAARSSGETQPHGAGPVDGGAAGMAAPAAPAGHGGLSARAIALAAVAALAIGCVLALLQKATDAGGTDALAAVAVSRGAALVVVGLLVAVTPTPAGVPRDRLAAVVAVGIGDTGANALFALASEAGSDAIAAILSSLYPVTTVLLARSVLGERMSRAQGFGILLALVGIALVSAR